MIFTLNSIHRMPQTFLIKLNIFVFIVNYFFEQHFYSHHLLFNAHFYHLLRMNVL